MIALVRDFYGYLIFASLAFDVLSGAKIILILYKIYLFTEKD
jgi:hypothetical protein